MQKNDKNIPKKVTVAVSFNQKVGGASTKSVIKTFEDNGANVIAADYREITPIKAKSLRAYNDLLSDKSLMLEALREAKKTAARVLEKADCLVIPGNNAMIDPEFYGKKRSKIGVKKSELDIPRTIAELALIHVATQRGMPILGICGGHQVINVFWGGELDWLSNESIKKQKYNEYADILILPNSEIGNIMRPKTPPTDELLVERVFGAHDQVVTKEGGKKIVDNQHDLFKVTACAYDKNTCIEAVEQQYGSPVIGVQFHPEVAVNGLQKTGGSMYRADSPEEIEQNEKFIRHFISAAETFNKKKQHSEAELRVKKQQLKAVPMQPPKTPTPTSEHADPNIPGLQSTKEKASPSVVNTTKLNTPKALTRNKAILRKKQAEAIVHNRIQQEKKRHKNATKRLSTATAVRPDFLNIFSNLNDPKAFSSKFWANNQRQASSGNHFKHFLQGRLVLLKKSCENYVEFLDEKINKSKGKKRKNYQKKYDIANSMKNKIEEIYQNKQDPGELNYLYSLFCDGYDTLSKRPDTATEIFLKAVVSFFAVLSIVGIFMLPRIWKIADKPYIKKIDSEFQSIVRKRP